MATQWQRRLLPGPSRARGATNSFFAKLPGTPTPGNLLHQGGGGFGGPRPEQRTFFWFSVEGYGSNTTRNAICACRPPVKRPATSRRPRIARRRPGAIYDPLTGDANGNDRQQFPGNIIPPSRLNPVAAKIVELPAEPDQRRQQRQQQLLTASPRSRTAPYGLQPVKVDHRFTDKVSLGGFYLYHKTDEPVAPS